jgi:putative AbiEii toxin of type IV toxin-antitoxin system/OLD-like protein
VRLASARLFNGTSLEFRAFNVLIGGNSTGKSTFLLELFLRTAGFPWHRWRWITDQGVKVDRTTIAEDMARLLASTVSFIDGVEQVFVPTSVKNLNGDFDQDKVLQINLREYESIRERLQQQTPPDFTDLLADHEYDRPFISFMNCETRLSLQGTSQLTDFARPPGEPLNALFRNSDLRNRIDEALKGQFNYHLTCLSHHGSSLVFGLSKDPGPTFDWRKPDLSREFERIEQWKVAYLTEIHECGHGVRSILKLLVSFYDPLNDILLIDEPELHIYPAQKRWLGRQLAQLAAERKKQVFVVTHDPVILQGILDSHGNTRVFRFEMDQSGGRAIKQCDIDNTEHIGAKKNQDAYLQALFYQRCVGVEGAADRAFYQNMAENLLGSSIAIKDLGFIACGGVGQSKHMVEIGVRVGLKMAFVYDFDALLLNLPVLRDIYAKRGGSDTGLKELKQVLKEKFGSDEKAIKLGTSDARKCGMNSSFARSNLALFEKCLKQLAAIGVFIVPGGAIESWAPEVENKLRFAEYAPEVILNNSALRKPLSEFLGDVVAYLT